MDILIILFLSFVPMLIYALVLWWLDRFEKEPLHLLALAFLWGAVPSIILSLILELIFDIPITLLAGSALTYDLLGSSIAAPLIEEGAKAVALVALLLFFRHEIDSPLDGVIYGGMVGFGFAAVENLFYLFGAYAEGGLGDVAWLAFLRAGLFGLNHAMYTGFTGLGIALALEIRSVWLKGLPPLLGFAMAVGTHAYHNALATFTGHLESLTPFVFAVLGDWLATAFLFGVIVCSRFLEQRRIRRFLQGYARALELQPQEIAVLTSPLRRWSAQLKALLTGDLRRWRRLARYFHTATKAAFAFHRAQHGDARAVAHLQRLEQALVAARGALLA